MKIIEVNTYTVRPRWGFVEIITDEGASLSWKVTAAPSLPVFRK